jgi:hypothetical protein
VVEEVERATVDLSVVVTRWCSEGVEVPSWTWVDGEVVGGTGGAAWRTARWRMEEQSDSRKKRSQRSPITR